MVNLRNITSLLSATLVLLMNPLDAADVTLTNGDFETGNGTLTGWIDQEASGGSDNDNYNALRAGSINSKVLHLKADGGNWVGQNMTQASSGAIDATSFDFYTVTFDYGYRAEVSSNWGKGDITLRIALWNSTTDTELAGYDLTITDPNQQQTERWQQAGKAINLTYSNTSQSSGDSIQLRITHVSPDLSLSWKATAMIDNISVTAQNANGLSVSQSNDFNSTGDQGGPFTPASTTYTLTNSSSLPLNWSATKTATWLTLSSSSGTLAAGASADLLVSIDSTANSLTNGTYSDTITISNLTTAFDHTRSAQLEVILPPGDSDDDGLPNQWEVDNGLDPNDDGSTNSDNGADGDPDNDGLPNDEEYFLDSDPQVNESGKAWLARPDKAKLMVINAHPDDEGIFFGGLIPYYTKVRQLPVVCVSMTSGDWGREPDVREAEYRNAAWAYGLRNQPIFTRFKDYSSSQLNSLDENWDVWADGVLDGDGSDVQEGKDKATKALAKWIRKYRPDVVATHDLNGEYGHYNHKATSQATIWAVTMAADASEDIEGLPAWQVKKLYLHNYSSNQLFHDFWQTISIDTTGNSTSDASPVDVANTGLDFHVTQGKPNVSTCYANNETNSGWEPYPCEWWGLYSTTVGADTVVSDFTAPDANNSNITYSSWAKGDLFENLITFPDTDGDGLPDTWETEHSVNDPTADDDGDGITNLDEFTAGLDPNETDSISISITATSTGVTFTIPAATGTGYESLSRHYQLVHSTDLQNWSDVVMEGTATGAALSYSIPQDGADHFYRLKFTIQ